MSNRRFLITGTSRSLGLALATELVERGHFVAGCSRSPAALEHQNYTHVIADISVQEQVSELFAVIREELGGIDVLINNAGAKIDRPALLTTKPVADEIIRTNLSGTLAVTCEAVKLMKRGRFGRIINFSSVAVPLGSVGTAYYGATKMAMTQYGHTLARELAKDDITVNTLGISVFADSDMVRDIDPAVLKEATKLLPKPSPLDIEEILHAVEFLTSDLARNISDQILYFGGVR